MIEEAAGTRLYESKKEAAQRTIEKKDAKLKEIDTVSLTWKHLQISIQSSFGYHIECDKKVEF